MDKKTDFAEPEASNLDTPHIGWTIRLKAHPQYFFSFREVGREVFIKYFPHPRENKEYFGKIVATGGKPFDLLVNQANSWLKIIDDGRKQQQRWREFFGEANNQDYTSYEVLDEEEQPKDDDSPELTPQEIENVRIFLKAFDDLIQSSKTLPESTKQIFSEKKIETEKGLEKNPRKSIYKWMGKLFDQMFLKYLTDSEFREEVHGYLFKAAEQVKHVPHQLFDWIKQIGQGQPIN